MEAVEQSALREHAPLLVEQLHGKPDAGLRAYNVVLAANAEVDGPIGELVGPVLDVELCGADRIGVIGELVEDCPVGDRGRSGHGVDTRVGGSESQETVGGTRYAVANDLAVDGHASFETGVDGGHAVGDELLEGVIAGSECLAHGADVAVRRAGGRFLYGVLTTRSP